MGKSQPLERTLFEQVITLGRAEQLEALLEREEVVEYLIDERGFSEDEAKSLVTRYADDLAIVVNDASNG